MFQRSLAGFTFVAPSKRKGKKYDVYKNDKYVTSFGALGYQHYKDKIGYYKNLDHNDTERRRDYRSRHKNDHINDPTKAGYHSWRFLW